MTSHALPGGLLLWLLAAGGCASSQSASLPSPPSPRSPQASAGGTARSEPADAQATGAAKAAAEAAPAPRGDEAAAGAASTATAGAGDAATASAGTEASGPRVETVGGTGASPAAGEARTPDERRDALDQKLDASLQAFDALLIKEQQTAAQERAERRPSAGVQGGGGEDGEAGGAGGESRSGERGRSQGGDRSGAKAGAGQGRDERAGEPAGGGRSDEARDDGRTPGAPGTESSQGSGGVPPDVGDGRDDDVVARQIREAAMKEQDPAIREKLWDEYRRYKAGRTESER